MIWQRNILRLRKNGIRQKNGDLKPTDVTASCNKKVWWFLPYDDPDTGKHFDFEWQSRVSDRINGNGCPYLSGRAVWKGFNDLSTKYPEIAKEWHPSKNGDLKSSDVTASSHKKVWWFLPYDDSVTGKHFDFEWEAIVSNRIKERGCPYLSGRKAWAGYNDLSTTHPELAAQWHPTKNGNLTPADITTGSGKGVWWLLSYDDPDTGKHFDFEWKTTIANRLSGNVCPYLSGRKAWAGYNDLAVTHPELAAEWHPTKNGDLKPTDVTAGSNKKVWWLLPYDDPNTGKHYDFEWDATINSRITGRGCPYLSGNAVWKGFNDLATKSPDIAKEWHPTKNGDLTPENVMSGCNKKVWWYGKCGHEWFASINKRFGGRGCPICAKELKTSFAEQAIYYYIKQKFPDAENGNRTVLNGKELDIYIHSLKAAVEHDGVAWHQDKEKNEIKNIQCEDEKIVLYRIQEKGCPVSKETKYLKIISYDAGDITGLENAIRQLLSMLGVQDADIDINRDRSKIYELYICSRKENSLAVKYPEVAKEWHPAKNGNLKPENVMYSSNKKVWWFLSYTDPKTGKHFDFEWDAKINSRVRGDKCPYLSGRAVWKGFNDLATTCPELATEWHPTKNRNLLPEDVTVKSHKKVWWLLPYDDPDTGKHFDFEWEATIASRSSGNGCPYLAGQKVWKGFNDLATTNTELAKEWHPTKNGDLTPTNITAGSAKKVWWLLPYDDPNTGLHFDFEWKDTINQRIKGNGCPYLSGRKVWKGFNDLATLYPEIAKEWHPAKNGNLTPENVVVGSAQKVWWLLPYDDPKTGKHFDFEWQAIIYNRTRGMGCPYLSRHKVWKGFNDLATTYPELAKQWHPTKNGKLTPSDVVSGSTKKVWWKDEDGKEFYKAIREVVNIYSNYVKKYE